MARANVINTLVVPEASKVFPYYDDFNEEKNFYRILARPGYAVQAREITQIQTILQNQVERFGRHVFVDGSSVIGGEIRYLNTITLNLAPEYANTEIDVTDFVNKTITYASGNTDVIARVVQATEATDTEPPTLYIGQNYITGEEFGAGSTIKVSGESVYANLVGTANVQSTGLLAFIDDSIFFYRGFFIKTPKQVIVVSKYTTAANARVGLEFDDAIITEGTDSSLLDPALESSNYQAPGAARYKADLVLAKRDLDSTDDDQFIEISRLENGVLQKNITTPLYSEIEEVMARRTYDESGNYTVKPFKIFMEDSDVDDANNVQALVSEGKGYILGYEFETIVPTKVQIPRARTTTAVGDYSLNLNYGNFVIVDNLNGDFDIGNMGIFDIHCVPYANVHVANTTTYNGTKIGTARVRDIEFYSGDTDVTTRKYEFYLFDTRFQALTGTASGTASALNQIVLNTVAPSRNSNAYNGATIRITGGTSSGDRRTIVSYDGATKVANVSTNFSALTDNTTQYSIEFDFGEAESFVRNTTYTAGVSANANTNITVLSKTTGLANGDAYTSEPNLGKLVFPFPESYIVNGSITDKQWNYRRVYNSVQFTNGVSAALVATVGEDFVGTTSSSNTSSTVMDNFLVIVSDRQSSGRVQGEQVKVSTSITGSPEQAVLSTANTIESFVATVYAKMQITDDTLAAPRVKSLVKANTLTFTSEAAANVFINSTGSNTSIYTATGQVLIRNPSRMFDVRESLYLSDVIGIKKIYDLAGAAIPAAGADLTGYTDVTSRYIFDDGQRDGYYDHASIRLRPGATPCAGPLVVCCRYFSTTTDRGYFSVDSYPSLTTNITEEGESLGTGYGIIPTYKGIALRDAIDFRPVRRNASNTALFFTLGGVKVPTPASDFQSDYQYYLGRRDMIVLTGNRELERVEGIPAKYPQDPKPPSRSMVLHILTVDPFTAYPNNVSVQYIENRRYTMRDIGLLDQRLTNMEYYVTLNTIEKNTLDMNIKDVDGLDRAKYGIFADTFAGHYLGDSALPDYSIATDIGGRWTGDGIASNEYAIKATYLVPEISGATGVAFGADKITLSYSTVPAITQNTATKFTPVADLLFASFEGNVLTIPESDIWKDVTRTVVVNQTFVVNETNLRRFISPWEQQNEEALIAQGLAPVDIINAWAQNQAVTNLWTGETNAQANDRGASIFGLETGETFLTTRLANALF